mgnify:CR=1 FL=1
MNVHAIKTALSMIPTNTPLSRSRPTATDKKPISHSRKPKFPGVREKIDMKRVVGANTRNTKGLSSLPIAAKDIQNLRAKAKYWRNSKTIKCNNSLGLFRIVS